MAGRRVIIIGAAGRDFHNFNTYYRDNEAYNVVAFTAAQIPDIEGRKYPAELAGSLYPDGIPIHAEEDLSKLIKDLDVDDCVFSYSDVPYQHVMSVGALVNAAGANFVMLGPGDTQIKSTKPVISVGAVRTGCGKSQTSRRIIEILMEKGLKVVAIRHPMPYGDLAKQRVNDKIDLARPDLPEDLDEPVVQAFNVSSDFPIFIFALSGAIHGGALVVNYPFDNELTGSRWTPDDDLFIHISEAYSSLNLPIWNGSWYHGITNGADWYSVNGALQDWAYVWHGNFHVLVEIKCNQHLRDALLGDGADLVDAGDGGDGVLELGALHHVRVVKLVLAHQAARVAGHGIAAGAHQIAFFQAGELLFARKAHKVERLVDRHLFDQGQGLALGAVQLEVDRGPIVDRDHAGQGGVSKPPY